jgi:hypothetical protein
MPKRSRLIPPIIVILCLCFSITPSTAATAWEIPFELWNGLIVVEGALGKTAGLKFIIDTGATCSLLNKPLIKKLRLRQEEGECSIQAFGQVTKTRRFCLPGLTIGPVFTTLHCLEADLAHWMVDGIIGLDLLRRKTYLACCKTHEVIADKNFTIDFESRTLRFGAAEVLPNSVALEVCDSQIVVPVRMHGRIFRLALDTGTNVITLFGVSGEDWARSLINVRNLDLALIGSKDRLKEVRLPSLEIGSDRWDFLGGTVRETAGQPLDGVLAVAPLRLKRLHIDFDRNILSWSR